MFIDMHCHILPHTDDGADSIFETSEIIENAFRTGTHIMVATPHYNYPEKCKKSFSKTEITERYKQLNEKIVSDGSNIKLFLGAEVLANENICELCKKNEIITINNSRYILTEFYFNEDIRNVFTFTEQLRSSGLIPIIAHPERYNFLQNQRDIEKLLRIGCKMQINKDSILGRYGNKEKQTAFMMLNNDYVDFIASDCHNAASRNADMSELYVKMLGLYSQNRINKLFHDNQKRVLLDIEF